jgi:cation transport regulator
MPYAANADLPDSVREALPARAETIWREAFNSAAEQYGEGDEGRLTAVAWSAVRRAGYGRAPDGRWMPRSDLVRITYRPTERMSQNAARALEVRATKPPSQRGMTPVGLARARDLANGRPLSFSTVQRMYSYLRRHEVDKQGATWDEQGKGWQAWQGWGGDSALRWSASILREALGDAG